MKILFLEDDILLNEIIQEHLENEGYRVNPPPKASKSTVSPAFILPCSKA